MKDVSPRSAGDGHEQGPIDGVSPAYTFADANTPGRKETHSFDIVGSRGVYHDGWFASAFGSRKPRIAAMLDINN